MVMFVEVYQVNVPPQMAKEFTFLNGYRLLFLTFVIIEEMAFLHLNLFIPSFTPSLQTNS